MSNATSQSAEPSPTIMGIWKLGRSVLQREATELRLAQPADSPGNPRFDYMLKRSLPTADPHARQTIIQQYTACQLVRHPNLVCVLDGSVSGQQPYIVMPRIAGKNLDAKLADPAGTPLPVVLWLVRQTAQAISSLHAGGWIHGDVKPANVIVDDRGHVTLLDLGFAARIHTPMGKVFRGTPDFAAPEMLNGSVAALPAMDIFALGRTLWAMLTRTCVTNQLQLEPVADLVQRMINNDPQRRPVAQQVIDSLLALELETLGSHIVPAAGEPARCAA